MHPKYLGPPLLLSHITRLLIDIRTWLSLATSPYVVFHHRALTSPVTRFVTINPSCYTLRDALTNKRGDSRPKMGFLTLRVSFPLFPPLSFLLFVLLLVPLNLFYLVHFNTDFLSMLFLSSYNLIFIHPGYSQDDVNG